jgi:hypothetical protein
MVGTSADDTDVDAVALVPAGKAIDNVDTIAGVEIVDCALSVDAPDLCFAGQYTVMSYVDALDYFGHLRGGNFGETRRTADDSRSKGRNG